MLYFWRNVMIKKLTGYFTKFELYLYSSSVLFILLSFVLFDRANYLSLVSSLIGVTCLTFGAKGNPISHVLTIIFSVLYGVISYSFSYYGEMITYLGMTLPMSAYGLYTWTKNLYKGNKHEVTVSHVSKSVIIKMLVYTALVTLAFYFILKALDTKNLFFSTISVTTSFAAVYLCAKRSPYFALAYALNDIVLIILWTLAAITDISYLSVIICFVVFLINDMYAFINWRRMRKRQEQ